jgi:nitrite reductase/ring-hydroxylating ferredoxin subunit
MLDKIEAVSGACANCAARTESDAPVTVGRRQFLSASLMAAAAAALAACASVTDSTSPSSVSLTLKVSDYAALANVGGVALVSANGSPLAVVRTGASTFVALSRICPHQGTTVNQTSGGFLCPNHGAQFNQTGTWIGGQRTSNMRSYATQYDSVTGTLTIG